MDSDDFVTAPRTVREPTRSISRYDLVLAVIPFAFLAAVALAYATGVGLQPALAAAAGVGALALVDSLFIRPPGFSGGTTRTR